MSYIDKMNDQIIELYQHYSENAKPPFLKKAIGAYE